MVEFEYLSTHLYTSLMNHTNTRSASADVLDHFVEQGYLSTAQLDQLKLSNAENLRSLIDNGLVSERALVTVLSEVYQLRLISRTQMPTSAVPKTLDLADFLIEHEVMPISMEDGILSVAMSDPYDEFALKVLRSKLECELTVCIALRSELLDALTQIYSASSSARALVNNVDLPDDLSNESTLVRDIHRLIQRAVSTNASDIHFEPIDSGLRVRFRVHGMLREIQNFDEGQRDQVIARLKLMSKLDVTQRRDAQNGRFKFPADGRVIDLRVSTLPLHNGESVVLRLLEFGLSQLSLTELGFNDKIAESLRQAIRSQQGLILVTGPTGSGKSTTLYSLLNQLNKTELKLISIEDPVELKIEGINQIQVDEEHGVSFSAALKTVLRQDPDVIMVGEIRDTETAQLAAQAALTGHLVLATLHTPSAASAVTRLQNLGLPKYLISSTVKAVLAQRLLRCVCHQCSGELDSNSCDNCAGTHYSRRTTIAELLPIEAFENIDDVSEKSLSNKLLEGTSLADSAHQLLQREVTDAAEVFRVLGLRG